ncbi:MAG: hypothetical protein NTX74_10115 [Flavobacterium sp.]|nr:hypothetical protein [Flavobacterium sp.]
MKKKYYILSIVFLIIQSCTSVDSVSNGTILVKKKIETNPDGVFTSIYEYDENKIVSAKLTQNDINLYNISYYTYTGNFITEVKIYNNSNTLLGKGIYNYNLDNKVSSYIELDYQNNTGRKATYTYNPNGTISSSEYEGSLTSQTSLFKTKTITFSNGEVNSLIEYIGSSTKTTYFIYDNKNSPYKNIIGIDKISYVGFNSNISEINHNVIQQTTINNPNNIVFNFQYNYDSNGYPTNKIKSSNIVIQYFY